MRIKAVLFDLDGTLADTAPDLIAAASRLRAELGLPILSEYNVRPMISQGGRAILRAALPELSEIGDDLLKRYLRIYCDHICECTRLFPGMVELLGDLERQGIPWGIVTNKPGWLTEPLVTQLGLKQRAGCIVAGDTLPQRKPSPEPLLHACMQLGVEPASACMIGDDERDILAAKAAGIASVLVTWGYHSSTGNPPVEWNADVVISTPEKWFTYFAS